MRLLVRHRTSYRFDQPQRRLVQLARLEPDTAPGQTVLRWDVEVGRDARISRSRDGYGNRLLTLYVEGPVDRLDVEVSGEALTEDRAGVVGAAPEPLPPQAFLRETALTRPDAAVRALAAEARRAGTGELERLHALMRALSARVRFDTGNMDVARTAAAALELGHGVCQDFAHLFAAAARAMDVPARYVSGHLFRRDGLSEQNAAHAWAEAWVDGLGWVGFDAANGVSPDDAYLRVAVGLDYQEAAPLSGARTGGGGEELDVAVSVVRSGGQRQGPGGQWQG